MACPPPGIYVPVPTFFTASTTTTAGKSAALDAETQAQHAIHLAQSGITGLVVLGSTGEAIHLSAAERFSVISGIRSALDGAGFEAYPLIGGTTAQGVDDAVAELKEAARAGASWGLCLVPGYFAGAGTQEGIRAWFESVADSSPVPVLIYHYPGVSNNVKVTPETFARLSRHANIVGCKLSHGDVSHHIQIASNPAIEHARFATFTGLGQQLLPVLSVGCAGAIDGSAGFFPKALVRLYELGVKRGVSEEEEKERRELQFKVSSVEELVVRYGTVGIKEAVRRVLGMGDGGCRLPLVSGLPGGEAEWARDWEGVVGDLEKVEASLSAKGVKRKRGGD